MIDEDYATQTYGTYHVTPVYLARWLVFSDPGDSLIYATGFLARDAERPGSDSLQRLRGLLWDALDVQSILLTQRRIDRGSDEHAAYEYHVQKRRYK